MSRHVRRALWAACGLIVVAISFRIASLSDAFVWGDVRNWPKRPIPEVIAWWLTGWLVFSFALRMGAALPPRVGALAFVVLVAAASRAAFFGTHPIQEDDAYRYLWDGRAVLAGVNPYAHAPAEVSSARAPAGDLATLRAFLEEPGARQVHSRINHPHLPTVYPPASLAAFAAAQAVRPWSLDGLRAVFLLAELATVVLLWFALRAAGANPHWCVVYAWCPLTIKEMANSPHHDALVAASLAAFLLCCVADKPRSAAFCLALAVASKLYPVLLAPVLLVHAWKRSRAEAVGAAVILFSTLVVAWAPFLHAGMFRGTGHMAAHWHSNAGVFDLLAAGLQLLPGGNAGVALSGDVVTRGALAARVLTALAIGAAALWASFARLRRPAFGPASGPAWELPFRAFLALSVFFALSPAQHPWYFAGLLPFAALFPSRAWILLTGLLALYYFRFWLRYHVPPGEIAAEYEQSRFALVRIVEWAPFYSLLILEAWAGRRAKSA
jgi:hypothetical protein